MDCESSANPKFICRIFELESQCYSTNLDQLHNRLKHYAELMASGQCSNSDHLNNLLEKYTKSLKHSPSANSFMSKSKHLRGSFNRCYPSQSNVFPSGEFLFMNVDSPSARKQVLHMDVKLTEGLGKRCYILSVNGNKFCELGVIPNADINYCVYNKFLWETNREKLLTYFEELVDHFFSGSWVHWIWTYEAQAATRSSLLSSIQCLLDKGSSLDIAACDENIRHRLNELTIEDVYGQGLKIIE
jgi:hypothetical protein